MSKKVRALKTHQDIGMSGIRRIKGDKFELSNENARQGIAARLVVEDTGDNLATSGEAPQFDFDNPTVSKESATDNGDGGGEEEETKKGNHPSGVKITRKGRK